MAVVAHSAAACPLPLPLNGSGFSSTLIRELFGSRLVEPRVELARAGNSHSGLG